MSNKLPPCDHDECPLSHCRQQIELTPARGSALDATSMSANGQYIVTLGEAIQRGASDFAKHQVRLRASMHTVAKMLRESAAKWKLTAETMRYDEPRGVRHALDVHVNLLRDMAAELDRPGETKYAPNHITCDTSNTTTDKPDNKPGCDR